METLATISARLLQGDLDETLCALYGVSGDALGTYRVRLLALAEQLHAQFGHSAAALFSAAGRTELGGNHTDHQHGRVLAAAIGTDMVAAAAPNGDNCIRIHSAGFPPEEIDLSVRTPVPEERGTTAALIRGVAARFAELGHSLCGFDACITSDIPVGAGLSSSAAFEVLLANILNAFCADGRESEISFAQVGQYAENVYFGKPCGLMDQMASSVGGIVAIDFAAPAAPQVTQLSFDFEAAGYGLCIIDCGGSHADLTDCYTAIPAEMSAIAAAFGQSVLRNVDEAAFWSAVPTLRRDWGDRAVLRAMHFFEENTRVAAQTEALKRGDMDAFLAAFNASGKSSFCWLQNVSDFRDPTRQPIAVTLALCERILCGTGGVRVHGGGFAGTVLALVPSALLERFEAGLQGMLGENRCRVLHIRRLGGIRII